MKTHEDRSLDETYRELTSDYADDVQTYYTLRVAGILNGYAEPEPPDGTHGIYVGEFVDVVSMMQAPTATDGDILY